MNRMNRRLQKWANEKRKILIQWTEEYDKILTEEGIKGEHLVSMHIDRNYVSDINAFKADNSKISTKSNQYLFHTKYWFKEGKKEGKNESN